MNWDQLAGKWKQFRGEAKVRWSKLSDNDLTAIDGHKDKLVGKLQEQYGISREVAEEQANEFAARLEEGRARGATHS